MLNRVYRYGIFSLTYGTRQKHPSPQFLPTFFLITYTLFTIDPTKNNEMRRREREGV